MFRRHQPIQNQTVAKHMRRFFEGLPGSCLANPTAVAEAYADHLFHQRRRTLVDDKKFSRSPFYVGIGVSGDGFDRVTKRSALVSDTLLLSHNGDGDRIRIRELSSRTSGQVTTGSLIGAFTQDQEHLTIHCPDLRALGQWIIDFKELLRAGIAWYLPTYSIEKQHTFHPGGGSPASEVQVTPLAPGEVTTSLDILVRDGRGVQELGGNEASPLASRIVKILLEIDLPFIDGVSSQDFSEITVNEFGSYQGTKSFLRQALAELDEGLQAVQSEREVMKIGQQIEDEIRRMGSQMRLVRKRRAVSVTGAAVGTVGALLVAVYGPSLQVALSPILGAAGAGSIWEIIRNTTDHSTRELRDDRWYYMWVLAKHGNPYHL